MSEASATLPQYNAAGKLAVNSVVGIFDQIVAQDPGESGRYTFPAGQFGELSAAIDSFDREGDQLSMLGRLIDSGDSEVMLNASRERVDGWIVDRERDVAFEYTTDAQRNVLVEQVPISKVISVCDFEVPEELPVLKMESVIKLVASPELPPHVGEYNGADLLELESLPGADKVWWMDMRPVMNGSEPIGQSAEDVWQTWQSLAATLSAWQINVTTNQDVYEAAGVTNSGIAEMQNIDEGSSSCGFIFGSRSSCNIHRYRNGYATGRILAHEVGHGLSLRHDGGDNGGEYFNGFSDFEWTPLMGNVWPGDRWDDPVYQWSKGEYDSATDRSDDLETIGEKLEYREDDIPTEVALVLEGTSVSPESNWGQIAQNTDTDSFTFSIGAGGGEVSLRIDRIEFIGGAMLDVHASIVDSEGMLVAEHNAEVARHAELDVELPAGDYALVVEGGGEGSPERGFSKYSSLGFYAIEGSITGGVDSGNSGAGGMGAGGMAGGGGMGGMGGGGGVSVGGTAGAAGGPMMDGSMAGAAGAESVGGMGGNPALGGAGGSAMTAAAGSPAGGSGGAGGVVGVGGMTGGTPSVGQAGPAAGAADSSGAATAGSTATTAPVLPPNVPKYSSGCAFASPGNQGGVAWWSALGVALLLHRRRRCSERRELRRH